MTEERRKESAGDALREGVRSVAGVLGALVETLEQTFSDLRDGSDLSPDRAKEAARSTVRKAQETVEDLRDRLDFVPRREFDELRAEVEALRAAVDALRGTAGRDDAPPPTEPPPDDKGHDFPIDEG